MGDKSEWLCRVCGIFDKSNVRAVDGVLCKEHAVYCGTCGNVFTEQEIDRCDWCKDRRCKNCGPLADHCLNNVRPPGHEQV